MKKLLLLLSSALIALSSISQNNFPVDVKNQQGDVPKFAYSNGLQTSTYTMQNVKRSAVEAVLPVSSIGNLYSINGSAAAAPGRALFITGFTVQSWKPVTIQIRAGTPTNDISSASMPEASVSVIATSTATYIPVKWILRNQRSVFVNCTNFLQAGDDSTWITITPYFYTATDDFNYAARKTIMWIGTSITNGSGPTSTSAMYHTLVRDTLRRLGASLRYELNGISGSTSTIHSTLFGRGDYDITTAGVPADVYVLELAVNDAAAPVALATSIANYTSFCTRLLSHPEKKDLRVLVQGATPLENNTWNAAATLLDSALKVVVNNLKAIYGSDRISFVDLSASFNRLTTTNFTLTDTPGSRIHPSNQGHYFIYSVGYAAWFATTDGQNFIKWVKK